MRKGRLNPINNDRADVAAESRHLSIISIRLCLVQEKQRKNFVFVKLEADEGIAGWGNARVSLKCYPFPNGKGQFLPQLEKRACCTYRDAGP